MSSSHTKRLLTSVVAVPLLVLLVLKGGYAGLTIAAAVVGTVGLLEYLALFFPKDQVGPRVLAVFFTGCAFWWFHWHDLERVFMTLLLASLAAALLWFGTGRRQGVHERFFTLQVVGFLYVPCLLGHLVLVRQWNNGVGWLFFLFLVVFSGDTAAYYFGRRFGRHKLCPNISPGKTVEGSLGGFLGSVCGGVLFELFWPLDCSLPIIAGLAAAVGGGGQLGDLFESLLKRSADRKDSGSILPGHGGVLDRIDGLLFAAPLLYYLKGLLFG